MALGAAQKRRLSLIKEPQKGESGGVVSRHRVWRPGCASSVRSHSRLVQLQRGGASGSLSRCRLLDPAACCQADLEV